MAKIETIPFNRETPSKVNNLEYGHDWPVVYVINNSDEAYIGETLDAVTRTEQHLANPVRQNLKQISIISDDTFNKSVILDLESYLIKYMSGDGKFKLQNGNGGISNHRYYNKEEYEKTFSSIWDNLKTNNLTQHSIREIENTDLFKYSPYKGLSFDQRKVVYSLLLELCSRYEEGINEGLTTIVSGGAGTGKTILAIYLMKLLADRNTDILAEDDEIDFGIRKEIEMLNSLPEMKIGLVVPMQSLRETVKNVFGNIKGLSKKMVLSPIDVPKSRFDLLIVDEAHRLRQRKALSQYPTFDRNNRMLDLDDNGTELDWILKCSKNQILFYDKTQSVKPSDVDSEKFEELFLKNGTLSFTLDTQFRCKGGEEYIKYVKDVLNCKSLDKRKIFDGYDLKMFDDIDEMISEIKKKDLEYGLCRNVAGYSWKWISKEDTNAYDINISNKKYRWNTVNKDWVNSKNAINEIGCIHTIQGYDLNYAGVIFGNEIKYYDNKIIIDKRNYYDLQGKTSLKSEDALKEYIVNIYSTLMTRGIMGTYVYVCDEQLRNFLKEYF